MRGKLLAWIAAIIGGIITAAIVAYLNIGKSSVTITGPSTACANKIFTLIGHVNGSYKTAYWTDSGGNTADFTASGGTGVQLFPYCPVGEITITLTAVSDNGDQTQATHDVNCVQSPNC